MFLVGGDGDLWEADEAQAHLRDQQIPVTRAIVPISISLCGHYIVIYIRQAGGAIAELVMPVVKLGVAKETRKCIPGQAGAPPPG